MIVRLGGGGVMVGVVDDVSTSVGDGVAVGEDVGVRVRLVGTGVIVGVVEEVCVSVGEGVGDGMGVCVGVMVGGTGVIVAVFVSVTKGVGVTVVTPPRVVPDSAIKSAARSSMQPRENARPIETPPPQ